MKYIPTIYPNDTLSVYAVIDGRTATLEWLQEQVGGSIQTTPAAFGDDLLLIVNENGKLLDLPLNDTATDMARNLFDNICGNVVIMKADGCELVPLDPDELKLVACFCASSHITTEKIEEDDE